jgi:hypothetical protein
MRRREATERLCRWPGTGIIAAMFTLLMMLASMPANDPIAEAAVGLTAQIEDDVRPGGDAMLVSLKTKGCKTRMVGTTRKWTIDWRKAEMVSLGDTFVFVSAPPEKFAIVGDASIPDQAEKLVALTTAMQDTVARCKKSAKQPLSIPPLS